MLLKNRFMKLSEFKNKLENLEELRFQLPDSTFVPAHFHITEVGRIQRHFIDCGGKERLEQRINFQLWVAGDVEHRLSSKKLASIISIGETGLGLPDSEIEMEYQGLTIEKYGLSFNDDIFQLLPLQTACLAEDSCGIPSTKKKIKLAEMNQNSNACCSPNSDCC